MCPISRLSSMATVVCFTSNEPFVDEMSLHGNRDFVVILNLDAWSVTPMPCCFQGKGVQISKPHRGMAEDGDAPNDLSIIGFN